MKPSTIVAPNKGRGRAVRYSKAANAKNTIRSFSRTQDISFALTNGQFSLVDLIDAVLQKTGAAHLLISTWSAGTYEIQLLHAYQEQGRTLSTRFILDASAKRGQATPGEVAARFGQDAVRTIRSHAKYVVITNQDWHVVIQTSMNLNKNPRTEQFSLTNCPTTASGILNIAQAMWRELPAGAREEGEIAYLSTIESVPSVEGVQMAKTIQMGTDVTTGA